MTTKFILILISVVLYLSAATWFASAVGKWLRWRNESDRNSKETPWKYR
jgi:hypothetical protein